MSTVRVRLLVRSTETVLLGLLLASCNGVAGVAPTQEVKGAARIQEALDRIKAEAKLANPPRRRYVFQEADVNDYWLDWIQRESPRGVTSLRVVFEADNRFGVDLILDLAQWGDVEDVPEAALLAGVLGNEQNLEVSGTLETSDGRGSCRNVSVRLNRIPVPLALASSVLRVLGSEFASLLDPDRSLELPWGIESIEISSGQVSMISGAAAPPDR